MKGSHRMIVESPAVRYDFVLNRNITILRGGSGTGKTTLINMLRDRRVLGEDSNIEVQCDKDYFVLEGEDWFSRLAGIKDRIVFIDEGNRFVSSRKFAGAIKESDNYYVIITREDLSVLPYSVQEIYELVEEKHTAEITKVYNILQWLYEGYQSKMEIFPSRLITEDTKAGYQFFQSFWNGDDNCISAGGKANVVNCINLDCQEITLIVVDGAAFGSEMDKVIASLDCNDNYKLFLPESFEWLILKSGVFEEEEIRTVIENPAEYIESKEYFSWERFFTAYLTELSAKKDGWKYTKKKLNPKYLENPSKHKIQKFLEQSRIFLPEN